MLSFPAHTTYRFQKLDRFFFKFNKTNYNETSSSWLRTNPGNTIKQTIASELLEIAHTNQFK